VEKEKIIRARAPVRIDFSGGWTDVDIFAKESKGFVVNAAINIYSYVTVKKLSSDEVPARAELRNKSVRIYSADFDTYEEAEEVKRLEYNGNVDLAKAAIHQIGGQGGIDIITRSNAPAGSGLGTSASMGVALIGALSAFSGKIFLPYELAEQASLIERQKLKILGGKQDHYASALGGINFMEFLDEEVKVSKLQLSNDIICELEKSLVLCYTGKSRLSGDIHHKVRQAFESGEAKTTQAIKNLKNIAFEMKNVLLSGDLKTFGRLLNDNWENQKALHPSVTNPQIDEIIGLAKDNGAIGGKACGAGGGGCILFYVQPDREHIVRRKLEENRIRIIDFNFEFNGIQIWRSLESY
jgi:D-glycero-alpha-D-manno-heptose-7-phosphate kinase